MSIGMVQKWPSCLGIAALLWLALPAPSWAQGSASCGVSFGVPCGVGCESHHCPPAFKYRYEGPPRIHWHHGCPHPICNPCDLPHWGFYETCWNPWPFPPNWTHCPSPPPAAYVTLNPYGNMPPPVRTLQPGATFQQPNAAPPSYSPNGGSQEVPQLPPPRRLEGARPGLNQ